MSTKFTIAAKGGTEAAIAAGARVYVEHGGLALIYEGAGGLAGGMPQGDRAVINTHGNVIPTATQAQTVFYVDEWRHVGRRSST